MKYQKINKKLLTKYFKIVSFNNKYILKYGNGINTIKINIPFILDEDCASLAGLMPDGSLIKDLMRIYFHQKKDISKNYLFRDLLNNLFSPSNKIFIRKGHNCFDTYTNSKTLARFFYHILQIPKSNKSMRIPSWVFKSPDSVKIAYLKQAFDMEGTILKSLREIRFITKDKKFAYDLKKLLKSLDITSNVKERIGGTHRTIQYRLSIYRKENFIKFKKIGFRVYFLKNRFDMLLKKHNIEKINNI